jgi:asparagine synthase (glutamine-hydrolysing)
MHDGRYVIIYNGEVYNYKPLRDKLIRLGAEFKTNSDTEVVLKAFVEWGTDAFDKFNGMFALAIWDKEEKRLTLARDHFGIKPLYYAVVGGADATVDAIDAAVDVAVDATAGEVGAGSGSGAGLAVGAGVIFASEIKPIIASGVVDKKPNDKTIYRYLQYRIHDDSAETFFAGVNKLMPGEYMVIDKTGSSVGKYTNLIDELYALSEAESNRAEADDSCDEGSSPIPYSSAAKNEYKKQLTEAVRIRLQSDVPVGTSLSGGLDSSAVAVLIRSLMLKKADDVESVGKLQNTFSAIFPGAINDEEKYVDAAISACKGSLNAHKIRPTADDFKKNIADFVRAQEEPLISTGPYAQYCVMREACKHVTVLLDGQGADETMAGYTPYYIVYLRQLAKNRQYGKMLKELLCSSTVIFRLLRFKLADKLRFRKNISFTSLLDRDFVSEHKGEKFQIENYNLKKRLVEDTFYNSIPSLLRYEDKNTMRFSIEGRVPFLDKEVIKYLFSLDDEAIIKNGWNKRVLRDATRGVLPDLINRRKNKIGFTTPEVEWFMRLKNYFYGIFLSESFKSRPYFDHDKVIEVFEGFIQEKNSLDTMTFWRIINLEMWFREFMDKDVSELGVCDLVPKGAGSGVEGTAGVADDEIPSEYSDNPEPKAMLDPNPGKKLEIEVDVDNAKKRYLRYPIQTEKVSKDTNLKDYITEHLVKFFEEYSASKPGNVDADEATLREAVSDVSVGESDSAQMPKWYLFVSEKIIAITQGRSYFIWDIKVNWWARTLSKFVTRTPAGIGLGSPFTMQLAINEAGLPKVLYASAGGAIGKLLGKKGVFYNLVGENVRAIDGPTEYSVYPANVSAKLAPKDPDKVSNELTSALKEHLAQTNKRVADSLEGVVVIDSNDIGRNVLGSDLPRHLWPTFEAIFADNPLGQTNEQTPICAIFEA